jgi:hypothetical protein
MNPTKTELSITWMKVYRLTNGKPFPDADICYLPRPCQHCAGTARRAFALCVGLPGHGHRLQQRDRHRQPDLYPLLRLPLLHGGLPLPRPLFQLVGSGLAQRHGAVPQPQCVSRGCGASLKNAASVSTATSSPGKRPLLRTGETWRKMNTRPPVPRPVRPGPSPFRRFEQSGPQGPPAGPARRATRLRPAEKSARFPLAGAPRDQHQGVLPVQPEWVRKAGDNYLPGEKPGAHGGDSSGH